MREFKSCAVPTLFTPRKQGCGPQVVVHCAPGAAVRRCGSIRTPVRHLACRRISLTGFVGVRRGIFGNFFGLQNQLTTISQLSSSAISILSLQIIIYVVVDTWSDLNIHVYMYVYVCVFICCVSIDVNVNY